MMDMGAVRRVLDTEKGRIQAQELLKVQGVTEIQQITLKRFLKEIESTE